MPLVNEREVSLFMHIRAKAREQAAKNALTLFVMAVGFVLTWTFILIATLWTVSNGE